MEIAASKGGAAGQSQHEPLWELSKRELVEIALHLATVAVGDEGALTDGRAHARIREELQALKANGIV
jgi:hypothetical protein